MILTQNAIPPTIIHFGEVFVQNFGPIFIFCFLIIELSEFEYVLYTGPTQFWVSFEEQNF